MSEATSQPSARTDLLVIAPVRDFTCANRGGTDDLLQMADAGPLCLTCADWTPWSSCWPATRRSPGGRRRRARSPRWSCGGAAVVDARGAVHGIKQVFVADASVIPTIPSANTNLPTIVVAERMARWLDTS